MVFDGERERRDEDLIEIGAYRAGTNPALDRALARLPVIDAFLRQATGDLTPLGETLDMLQLVATAGEGGAA